MTCLRDDLEKADRCAEVLKSLAHPLRLRIVAALTDGDEHVGALASRLGATQPAVSAQLRILRMRGLVAPSREGGFVRYQLAEPRLVELVACVEGCGAR